MTYNRFLIVFLGLLLFGAAEFDWLLADGDLVTFLILFVPTVAVFVGAYLIYRWIARRSAQKVQTLSYADQQKRYRSDKLFVNVVLGLIGLGIAAFWITYQFQQIR